MSKQHILLIPAKNWKKPLYKWGLCGQVVPMAFCSQGKMDREAFMPTISKCDWYIPGEWDICGEDSAVILVWDGRVIPESMGRVKRVLALREQLPKTGLAIEGYLFDNDGANRWLLRCNAFYMRYYAKNPGPAVAKTHKGNFHVVRGLEPEPQNLTGDLVWAWALAMICQARGLGTAVFNLE